MASHEDWISRYRTGVTSWLLALNQLLALKEQYTALDLGNALDPGDFTGANADVTKEHMVAAVGSIDALNTAFLQGHNTNLYSIVT